MRRARIAAVALLVLVRTAASAQETTRLAASLDSKLWIEGASNFHGWSCKADRFEAAIDLDPVAAAQPSVAPAKIIKRVHVKVPVTSLKCGHGAMDESLYQALNAGATDISYIVGTFDASPGETNDTLTLKTVGTLTIAGKENPVAMNVTATRAADGR